MTAMRSLQLAAALFVIVGVVSAIAYGTEPAAKDESAVRYTIVYELSDLPVYRIGPGDSGFDPSILFALIKKAVDPESWDKSKGHITTHPQKPSCIISQTVANHAKVKVLLASLRSKADKH